MMPRESPPNAQQPVSEIPRQLRVAGVILRGLFILSLGIVTIRVSFPQNERLWSIYETPGDLVRVVLGLAAGTWILVHLFRMPHDAQGYRTWVYFGLFAVPFALFCAFATW